MPVGWTHNSAYYDWVVEAARPGGDALDVGCGDGALLARLAAVSASVTGVEPDPASFAAASRALAQSANAVLIDQGFLAAELPDGAFDLVSFVASLHHMPVGPALAKAARLLRPGGRLRVVGLARNASPLDWLLAGLQLPVVRLMGVIKSEARDPAVVVARPRSSLAEIRAAAAAALPGCRVRRGLYYRYLLSWTKPPRGAATTTAPGPGHRPRRVARTT